MSCSTTARRTSSMITALWRPRANSIEPRKNPSMPKLRNNAPPVCWTDWPAMGTLRQLLARGLERPAVLPRRRCRCSGGHAARLLRLAGQELQPRIRDAVKRSLEFELSRDPRGSESVRSGPAVRTEQDRGSPDLLLLPARQRHGSVVAGRERAPGVARRRPLTWPRPCSTTIRRFRPNCRLMRLTSSTGSSG